MTHLRSTAGIVIVLLLFGAVSADSQIRNTWGSGNIVHVAKSGKGFRSIQAALDSIVDASEDNPYLVSVAPGVYEEQVTMKGYVVVEGAGEQLTTIRSTGGTTVNLGYSEYTDVGHRELRSLTVECVSDSSCTAIGSTGGWTSLPFALVNVTIKASGSHAVGVFHSIWDSFLMKDVSIEIRATSNSGPCAGFGIFYDDPYRPAEPPVESWHWWRSMDNLQIRVVGDECQGWGLTSTGWSSLMNSSIFVDSSSSSSWGLWSQRHVNLTNVKVSAPGCALKLNSATVRHSAIFGDICIPRWSDDRGVRLSHSEFAGEVDSTNGYPACFSVHDADLNPLDENCEPIP